MILILIITLIVISSIFIGGTEIGKYKFLSLVFVPLLSKLQREKKSDNFTRGQILGYIKARPGEHYNAIKYALELNNGTLAYHVRILEKSELIYSKRDGLYTRFYPVGMKAPLVDEPDLNDTQKNIIEKIRENPGITQHEIVESLDVSQQVISYNLSNLTRDNIIITEQNGREKKYFLNQEDAPDVNSQVQPASSTSNSQ
jgi:predicted transcriptional regulator